MMHPDTELRKVSDAIGLGVFATRPIPRGTITWAMEALDQCLDAERVRALGRRYRQVIDRYAYLNGRGEQVLCWDIARFTNHSCAANSISTAWDFDIAVRDIEAGEEITNDYTLFNLVRPFECGCGTPECRGVVSSLPAAWQERIPVLDILLRDAWREFGSVAQPLWPWLREKRAARRALRDPTRLPTAAAQRFETKPRGGASGRAPIALRHGL